MQNELPDRKHVLMIRDPLVQSYDNKFKLWLNNHDDENLRIEVSQLENQVEEKWAVEIYIPETTIQGLTDFWFPVAPTIYVAVKDARNDCMIRIENNKQIFSASFKKNGLIYCDPHKIPIIIDPTILTINDAKIVKKAVWDIIKAEVGKQRSTIKGRTFAVPPKEPEALAAVFRCRSKSFTKYLRWYDLKQAGLSFRLIALIEFFTKNTEDREQKFERHVGMKKKPRIGLPVNGESTIREGFGLIYQAIFRTSPPTKEDLIPTSELYNCPHHVQDCPEDCDYLNRWYTDFENKYKERSLKEQLSPF
jgi:hypothetical protein